MNRKEFQRGRSRDSNDLWFVDKGSISFELRPFKVFLILIRFIIRSKTKRIKITFCLCDDISVTKSSIGMNRKVFQRGRSRDSNDLWFIDKGSISFELRPFKVFLILIRFIIRSKTKRIKITFCLCDDISVTKSSIGMNRKVFQRGRSRDSNDL